MANEIVIEIKKSFTPDEIVDFITTALEGGSNYWYEIKKVTKPRNYDAVSEKNKDFKLQSTAVCDGGSIKIIDAEEEIKPKNELNIASIKKGLSLLFNKYPAVFNNLATDNYDAYDADSFLQMCIFEDVVFG